MAYIVIYCPLVFRNIHVSDLNACAVTLPPDAFRWYIINVILRRHFDVGMYEVNRSNCGQTNSAGLHGPGTRKRRSRTGPDRIFIGQCETTLVQVSETNERDSSGGKSS